MHAYKLPRSVLAYQNVGGSELTSPALSERFQLSYVVVHRLDTFLVRRTAESITFQIGTAT
jgi:hypothetical protein